MASFLPEILFEICGQAPSPIKDFYCLVISKSDVILRWWKISLRNEGRNARPGQQRESHLDYLDDSQLQSQVSMIFGHQILEYTRALCQGHYDYLERLPEPLLLRILMYLELEDVGQLGRTSHRFSQLCGSEEFWEKAVRRRCDTVSAEVSSLALEVGWQNIFFTSKLQIQKQISRRRLRTEQQQERKICDSDNKAEVTSLRSCTESPGENPETDAEIHRAEAEPHPGIILDPSAGTSSGLDTNTSPCCDSDPVPNPELEAGSLSSVNCVLVCDQLCEDLKRCVVATPAQGVSNGGPNGGKGDCDIDLAKIL